MGKNIGNDYGLYVSDAEPTTPGDITEYELVGFGTDLNFNRSRNQIDASNKDSGEDSEFISGRRTSELSATFYADEEEDGDAGQDLVEEVMASKEGKLYWLVTDNVEGHKQYYGEAGPSQFDMSMPDEGMLQVDTTLQITGTVTKEAVPAPA